MPSPEDIRKRFAEAIKRERTARNICKREVAAEIDVSREWMLRAESGNHRIGILHFLMIAQAVGFDGLRMLQEHYDAHIVKGDGNGGRRDQT